MTKINDSACPIMLFVFILTMNTSAQNIHKNDVYLKIQPESSNPVILILPPFQSDSNEKINSDLHEVIKQDLQFTGFFELILKSGYIADTSTSFFSQSVNGAMAQVKGQVKINKNSIDCRIVLEELPRNRLIFEKDFSANISKYRQLAHKISDEITYYLVGEHGLAQTKIAFVIDDGNSKNLALLDYDGINFQHLTSVQSLNLSPSWLLNGEGLIFMSYLSSNPDLRYLNLSSNKITALPLPEGIYSAPACSPDGKHIAFTYSKNGNSEIFSSNLKGGDLKRLTSHPAIDSSPCWSPTGREIAFTSDRSGNPQIYLMDSEGGNLRRLTFMSNYNDSPVWSPKGDLIAYVSREQGGFQIYVIDIHGENLRKITDSQGSNENPSWSPDGLQLTFASNRNGRWNIYVTNLINLVTRQLTYRGGCYSPKWSPRLIYQLN